MRVSTVRTKCLNRTSSRFAWLPALIRSFMSLNLCLLLITCPLLADELDEILALEFQELVQVKITSVSKSEQNLYDASAAIFVLTAEDIRRSSANSIVDLLRLVPGLDVAQSGSNSWAISARGFQDTYANKMLVMVDGRSVYTIGFGGVFWEQLDLVLQDIERIEVIRGPGGAVWGVNAVNGVINIITKDSAETQGWHVRTGAGNEELGFGTVRYGGTIGEQSTYRLYAKGFQRDELEETNREDIFDDWSHSQTGFRIDTKPASSDRLTVQGDYFLLNGDQPVRMLSFSPPGGTFEPGNLDATGGNVLGRWEHQYSKHSLWTLQGFIDQYHRSSDLATENSKVYDLDLQNTWTLSPSFQTVSGVNSRVYDHTVRDGFLSIDPERQSIAIFDAFVNFEKDISAVTLTLGTKVGHNEYTDWEYQPSARVLWRASESQRVWAAVSRAVRIPSRFDTGATFLNDVRETPSGLPGQVILQGDPSLGPEVLFAYELGYRAQATNWLYADLALFFNDYDDLVGLSQTEATITSEPVPSLLLPAVYTGSSQADLWGGELVMTAEVTEAWKLIGTYSYLQPSLSRPDSVISVLGARDTQRFVHNKSVLRSLYSISDSLELDTTLRYVDSLASLQIPSYVELDVRFGFKLSPNVELSLIGRNLLDSSHREHLVETINPQVEVERSIFWRLDVNL